jgi:hypothetical protein
MKEVLLVQSYIQGIYHSSVMNINLQALGLVSLVLNHDKPNNLQKL